MGLDAIAVIKKLQTADAGRPGGGIEQTFLAVVSEDGKEYGRPRFFNDFREVAVLLRRDGGVTHEQLHEHFASYQRGEEVRLCLTLGNAEALKRLGFNPDAA